jgi:hypothetical protein
MCRIGIVIQPLILDGIVSHLYDDVEHRKGINEEQVM